MLAPCLLAAHSSKKLNKLWSQIHGPSNKGCGTVDGEVACDISGPPQCVPGLVTHQVGKSEVSNGLRGYSHVAFLLRRVAPGPLVGPWSRSHWWGMIADHLRSSVAVILASAGKSSNWNLYAGPGILVGEWCLSSVCLSFPI